MNIRLGLVPALAAGALLLSACGSGQETAGGGAATEVAATGDSEFDTVLRCWALTSGAYFQHMAMAGKSGNLPNPDEAVYTGWAKKLAIMSFKKGMGFKAFNEMKNKAKRRCPRLFADRRAGPCRCGPDLHRYRPTAHERARSVVAVRQLIVLRR